MNINLKIKTIIISVIVAGTSVLNTLPTQAKLVFITEENIVNENNLVINADDSANDYVDLEFGSSLGVKLRYDILNNKFNINRDLDLGNNQISNLRIENLPSHPICNASSLGRIYFNTIEHLTYTCDGSGYWNPLENSLNETIEFPVVQARRTTSFPLSTAYTDVELDVTDVENDTTTLDHDNTLRDRINIGSDAMYQIIYGYTAGGSSTGTHEARAHVRVNDTSILSGSESVNKNYQGEFSTTSASFLAHLNSGDFISLQLKRDDTADTTQDEIYFSITKLEGIKGEKGDPGSDGVILGFIDDESFTIDNNNTGGDLKLIFGESLNKFLSWNNVYSRFELNDTLRLSGNLEQNGNIMVLDADNTGGIISLQFGESLGESLTWDSTNSRFNLSDSVKIEGDLEVTGNINSECGPSAAFTFERGTVVSNRSWALGNGQTPYGTPAGCNGTVKKLAATCTNAIGTSLTAVLRKNNVPTNCIVDIATTRGQVTSVSCSEPFNANDVLGVYAGTENGNWTECVGTIWVKYD